MPYNRFRLWSFQKRDNQTWRPWKILVPEYDLEEEEESHREDERLKESQGDHLRRTLQSIKNNKNRLLYHPR